MPALGSRVLTRFMGACYLQDELSFRPSTILFVCSVYEAYESEYCSFLVTRELEGM